jgi:hypothetical protein
MIQRKQQQLLLPLLLLLLLHPLLCKSCWSMSRISCLWCIPSSSQLPQIAAAAVVAHHHHHHHQQQQRCRCREMA